MYMTNITTAIKHFFILFVIFTLSSTIILTTHYLIHEKNAKHTVFIERSNEPY